MTRKAHAELFICSREGGDAKNWCAHVCVCLNVCVSVYARDGCENVF